MKRILAYKAKVGFLPGAFLAEGQMWDETGLDGSVWPDLAGKRNPSSNRDGPDGFLAGFDRFGGPKPVWMALACLGIPVSGPNSPNGPVQARFGPHSVFGQKCPGPKARLFFRSRYPFHGTLLGASPRADIRKSLHSMGLRTSL